MPQKARRGAQGLVGGTRWWLVALCSVGILANLVLSNVNPSPVWDLNIAFFSLGFLVELWRK
jgi:hypothetical protein